jgi:hypothetical protein
MVGLARESTREVLTMPLVRLDALCACEGCYKRFGIELDIGRNLADESWLGNFDAVVREEIASGRDDGYVWGVRGQKTVERFGTGSVSIQGGLMLCSECTKKCDRDPRDTLDLAAVREILGMEEEEK